MVAGSYSKESCHRQISHLQEVRRRFPGRDRHPELAEQVAYASFLRPNRVSDNAPSHRVYVAAPEIGAPGRKRSNEGASIGQADPIRIMAPIYANLVEDGEAFASCWSRTRRQKWRSEPD